MRGRHPKAAGARRGPSVHHVRGHVARGHHREARQRRRRHPRRALQRDQPGPGAQQPRGRSLQPHHGRGRRRGHALGAKEWNSLGDGSRDIGRCYRRWNSAIDFGSVGTFSIPSASRNYCRDGISYVRLLCSVLIPTSCCRVWDVHCRSVRDRDRRSYGRRWPGRKESWR